MVYGKNNVRSIGFNAKEFIKYQYRFIISAFLLDDLIDWL